MMIYVFGDLRQLRSFELARFPDPEPSKAKPEGGKPKLNIRILSKLEHPRDRSDSLTASPQALTGPPPPLAHTAASHGGPVPALPPSDGQQSRAPRQSPPKLHIVPPQPAHTRTPVRTSYCAYPDLARMQSISSASISHSIQSGKRGSRQPCFAPLSDQECDTDDDLCGASGSDYESDYSSGSSLGSDESSDASHSSITDEGVSMQANVAIQKRRRARRRRRRREPEIYISDAFFDEHPCPEGPATADPQDRAGRTSVWGDSSEEDVGMGATFIHPFQWDEDRLVFPSMHAIDCMLNSMTFSQMCTHDIESQAQCAAEHQRMDSFDFDGLPPPRTSPPVRTETAPLPVSSSGPTFPAPSAPSPSPAPVESEKPSRVHFADSEPGREPPAAHRPQTQQDVQLSRFRRLLGFIQQKCGPQNVAMQILRARAPAPSSFNEKEKLPEPRTPVFSGPLSPSSTLSPPSPMWPSPSHASPPSPTSTITMTATSTVVARSQTKTTWQARVRRMLEVPAFASPLTPVLNPVVTRGQWEIVVRSAFIALVVSAVVVGALVAVPETRVVR